MSCSHWLEMAKPRMQVAMRWWWDWCGAKELPINGETNPSSTNNTANTATINFIASWDSIGHMTEKNRNFWMKHTTRQYAPRWQHHRNILRKKPTHSMTIRKSLCAFPSLFLLLYTLSICKKNASHAADRLFLQERWAYTHVPAFEDHWVFSGWRLGYTTETELHIGPH